MTSPLTGVRIPDLSAVLSASPSTGLRADQGADVIKVEARGGDILSRGCGRDHRSDPQERRHLLTDLTSTR